MATASAASHPKEEQEMTIEIYRADPTGIPPDNNPATAVPLAVPDRAVIVLGVKMFGSSNTGFISRSDQQRRIGYRSNGRFGSTSRSEPSHGHTVIISFDGTILEEDTVKTIDQFVKDQLADLIFRKLIIVTANAGPRFTPTQMRTYV